MISNEKDVKANCKAVERDKNRPMSSLQSVAEIEGDSSESDGETEPAKSFHRRISTNKEIKCAVSC